MTKHQSEPNAQPASEPSGLQSAAYELAGDTRLAQGSFRNRRDAAEEILKRHWHPAAPAGEREESLNSLEARLAADIRAIDGNHDKGAAELAEQLIARGWHPAPAGERNAELSRQRNDLAAEVDRLDWLVKRETGTWLETRDANQRLTDDAAAARQQAAIVLNSMEWDGDGYCWTGGQWDYRLTPSEAVELTASKIKNLESSNTALQAKLDAVAGLVEKWRRMHSYWWADELAAALE
jgi:hypothetical protein